MNQNRFAYIVLATSIFCAPKAICQNAKELLKTKQPNIIFTLADDLGYGDLGVFLQKQREKANNRSEPCTFPLTWTGWLPTEPPCRNITVLLL